MPESIELSRFVSNRVRMSGKFDSRKDSQSTKFEWRPSILVKLSFRELCDSKNILDCQKHFAKLQKMKNTQWTIKPIKIGKQSRTTYCLQCQDHTHNFRPQEEKVTNKVLREKSNYFIFWSNKSRFFQAKSKLTTNVMKIRWRLIAWSVERILKILTQKWLEQKIID